MDYEATQAVAKRLAELFAHVQGERAVGEPTCTYLSVTGEPYVIIGYTEGSVDQPPGVVEECVDCHTSVTVEDAFDVARRAFDHYADDRTGALYWRVKPELMSGSRFNGPTQYRVYMRLLISDKPPIAKKED